MRDVADIPVQSLLEALASPLVILDVDLHIVTANSAFYQLFQLRADDVEKCPVEDIELLAPFRGIFEAVLRDRSPVDFEFDQVFPFGRKSLFLHAHLIVKDDRHLPMVAVEFEDVTAHKRREERFQGLLESAPDAMVIVDQQGVIVLTNAQVQTVFGYDEVDLIGQTIETLVPERFRSRHPAHRAIYKDDPHMRSMGAGMELYAVRKDGSEFPVEISLSPLETEEGVLISSAIRDITERKTLDELQAALEREKKINELKSRFVSMMSHEIRTPLTGIQTSAELIQLHGERMGEERKEQHLARIQEHVKDLTYLLDDILTLSKAQTVGLEFEPVPLNLRHVCETIVRDLPATGLGERVRFTHAISNCPQIVADPKLLTQAIANLLINALKYSPTHSPVLFHVECDRHKVQFRVSDQGIGVPEADQKYLFQLFYRSSNVGAIPGTGLGLAIVREIMDLHQGNASVESAVGEGTTFTLTLPLV